MKITRIVLKIEIFVLLFALILGAVTFVLRNKDSAQAIATFYKEPKNSLDVVFFGTSHMLNAVIPNELWEQHGIASYNYAQHWQPFLLTYESMQEVLKHQSPKLLIVDLLAVTWKELREWKNDSPRAHKVTDNIPFSSRIPVVMNYTRMKNYSIQNQFECIFPLYLFHSNWINCKKLNYIVPDKYQKGMELRYGHFSGTSPEFLPSSKQELSSHRNNELMKIINLCKKNKTKLLFTVIPYDKTYQNITEALETYNEVAERIKSVPNVDCLNYFYCQNELGFDYSTDLYNKDHVNPAGAYKITAHLGNYIKAHYNIPDRRQDPAYDKWNNDYLMYKQERLQKELRTTKNIYAYLKLLQTNGNLTIFFNADMQNPPPGIFQTLQVLGLQCENKKNYLAIIDGGKVIYENVAEFQLQYKAKIGKLPVSMVSGKSAKTENGSIRIDGIEKRIDRRGLGIVVYDKLLKTTVDSVTFDIIDNNKCYR